MEVVLVWDLRENIPKPDSWKPCTWGEELQASQKILLDRAEVSSTVEEPTVPLALVGFVRRLLWAGLVLFAFPISWALDVSW